MDSFEPGRDGRDRKEDASLLDGSKAAYLDFVIEVVRRMEREPGFRVPLRRWVVKRTFA